MNSNIHFREGKIDLQNPDDDDLDFDYDLEG